MRLLLSARQLVAAGIVAILLALMGLVAASPSWAAHPSNTQDFEFASFDAEYHLGRNSSGHATLTTVETLVAVFPDFDQNRGIIRAIPDDYDGVPLHTRVVGVVDEHGDPVPYEETHMGGFVELALGTDDFVHGHTTYVITYEQRNVVRAFADTDSDEFYWDVNGTGWAQPFHSVTARVHVDAAIAPLLTDAFACYAGAYGEQGDCVLERRDAPASESGEGSDAHEGDEPADGSGESSASEEPGDAGDDGDESGDAAERSEPALFVASASDLAPFETLTVAIGFEPGTFVQVAPQHPSTSPGTDRDWSEWTPPAEASIWAPLVSGVTALLAVAGAVFVIVRRFRDRDAPGRGIIIPQYTPPKNISVLEAGQVAGIASRSVTAQIISFAVRKKVRILDYAVTASRAQYSVQLLDTTGLDDLELQLMAVLSGSQLTPGTVVELGVVDDALASGMSTVNRAARARVRDRGLMRDRSSTAGCLVTVGIFVLAIVAGFSFVASAITGGIGWTIAGVFVVGVAFLASAIFAFRPAAVTEAGAELRDYLFGIRDYLRLAEADRIRMLQSASGAERVDVGDSVQMVKFYEKLLPFAVLWGIEREWARELAVRFEATGQQPEWFVTSSTFSVASFANAMGGLSSAVTSSSTTTTSSSSWSSSSGGSFSGGSFGGGFSGGGGGGGGGGGR